MTATESMAILAILQTAYPNSFKNVKTDADAENVASVWAVKFADIPVKIVLIAVNKWIDGNDFPPSIHQLKRKIEGLYYEAWETLQSDRMCKKLSPEQIAELKQIQDVTARMRSRSTLEPSLLECTVQASNLLPGV